MSITNIGFFGKRNVGKSSVVNMLLGQDFSIVSDTPGTTTDPVKKRIEIFGLGPCQLIDTAGVDDLGELGKMRVAKSIDVISQVDVGILVFNDNFLSKEEFFLLGKHKSNPKIHLKVNLRRFQAIKLCFENAKVRTRDSNYVSRVLHL